MKNEPRARRAGSKDGTGPDDCPSASGGIDDFNNVHQVFKCELLGLADLDTSSDWQHSSAVFNISKLDQIPPATTDPRAWPVVYHYEGNYDPLGNATSFLNANGQPIHYAYNAAGQKTNIPPLGDTTTAAVYSSLRAIPVVWSWDSK